MNSDGPIVIGFVNQKGGVAKTTSATCVAAGLAKHPKIRRQGKRVLLIDLDFQGSASKTFLEKNTISASLKTYDFFLRYATYDVKVSEIEELKNRTFSEFYKTVSLKDYEIDVMPHHIDWSDLELKLFSASNRERILKNALKQNENELKKYSFIILDFPPSLSLISLNGLIACDYIYIPNTCDGYASDGLNKLVSVMHLVNERYEAEVRIGGIFLTQFIFRENVHRETFKLLRKIYGNNLLDISIPKSTSAQQSTFMRLPLIDHDPKTKASLNYLKLTNEIIKKTKND